MPDPVQDHFTQGEPGLYTHETAKRRASEAKHPKRKAKAPETPGPSDSTPEAPAEAPAEE